MSTHVSVELPHFLTDGERHPALPDGTFIDVAWDYAKPHVRLTVGHEIHWLSIEQAFGLASSLVEAADDAMGQHEPRSRDGARDE